MRQVLAGMLLVVALALAGCGGGSSSPSTSGNGEAAKPAQQVLTDTVNAADAATSLHLSGNISGGGEQIGVDLRVAKNKGATGTVTLNGSKVQLIIIGSDAYIKADAKALQALAGTQGAAVAPALANQWLKAPTNDAKFQGILAFSNPQSLFDQLKSGAGANLKNNGVMTYKGQSAVALDDGAANGTLYVAATGTPFPVALVKTGTAGGALTFSDWNKAVTLTAPSGAIDISKLGG